MPGPCRSFPVDNFELNTSDGEFYFEVFFESHVVKLKVILNVVNNQDTLHSGNFELQGYSKSYGNF